MNACVCEYVRACVRKRERVSRKGMQIERERDGGMKLNKGTSL